MTEPAALVAFLRARMDEDVAAARRAMTAAWTGGPSSVADLQPTMDLTEAVIRRGMLAGVAAVEQKRASYALDMLRTLALPYAEHPDYRAEWALPAAVVELHRTEPPAGSELSASSSTRATSAASGTPSLSSAGLESSTS